MIVVSRNELQDIVGIDAGTVNAIRDAYVAVTDGRATIPPVGYLAFAGRNADCHIKYGYIEGDPIFVIKIAAGFYDNPKRGLPSSTGIILAISAETGAVRAALNDEGWLTDLRTAIGGAVATQALARPDAETVTIVGSGTQARFQIRAMARLEERPSSFAVWGRDALKVRRLVAEFADTGISVVAADDLETACREADVIVTTTSSSEALVMREWVQPGAHVTAMGADAPGKRELDPLLVAEADLRVADKVEQSLDHGEFSAAFGSGLITAADCVQLGDVLAGKVPGRASPHAITVADLTGVATQDIAVARTVLERLGARAM